MNYPEEIDKILKDELNNLIKMVKDKTGPFNRALHLKNIIKNMKK